MENYVDLGTMIDLDTYWEPEEVLENTYQGWKTSVIKKEIYLTAIRDRMKIIARMKENRTNMYRFIMSKLSTESKDELPHQKEYERINREVNLLELCRLTCKIHQIMTISKYPSITKRATYKAYAKCRQGGFETIVDFGEKIEGTYQAYKEQGNAEKSEEDRVVDFLHSLDMQQYGNFVVETVNNMSAAVMNQPATVNDVFTITNTRLIVKRSGGRVEAMFATIEEKSKGS